MGEKIRICMAGIGSTDKCEGRALSHSIISGSTTDKSVVCYGSKCGTEVNYFIIILKRLKQ